MQLNLSVLACTLVVGNRVFEREMVLTAIWHFYTKLVPNI